MTRIPALYPGETILTAGVDVATDRIEIEVAEWNSTSSAVIREGGQWNGDSTFAVFQQHMHQTIAQACGVKPVHVGRKTCLSCGAIQTSTGDLPCGH